MTHREVTELLPWYANATLSEDERREVEKHLLTCTPCSRELEALKTIQMAVVESAEEMPEPSRYLLNQAMAKVEEHEREKTRVQAKRFAWSRDLWEQLQETLFGWWGPTPAFARLIVAAQLVLIVGLAGGLAFSLWNQGEFSTLSGTSEGRGGGTTLTIRFNESITEAEFRQTLREIQGTIVSGPSSLGLYDVQVPIFPSKTQEIEKLLQSLRENRRVIGFAERK